MPRAARPPRKRKSDGVVTLKWTQEVDGSSLDEANLSSIMAHADRCAIAFKFALLDLWLVSSPALRERFSPVIAALREGREGDAPQEDNQQ